MGGLYQKFETDADIEQKGVILDYGDGVRIRIRRAGGSNKEYLKAMEKVARSYRFQIQHRSLSRDENLHILAEVYASTIVIGWEGVTDRDGKALPFSKENCMKLFKDLPDLFADVQAQAESGEGFRKHLIEADAKN